MTDKIKYPEELFVTIQRVYEKELDVITGKYENTTVFLDWGFLNAYEPHLKSFKQKQQTQLSWATGGYYHSNHVEQDSSGRWFYSDSEYDYTTRVRTPFTKYLDPQPQIWKNEPLTGFKIHDYATRYSTSNKLWEIMDPRGVIFEITCASFNELIKEVDIIKGEIVTPCVWKSNKNLIAA
jgi:hypothetical protein